MVIGEEEREDDKLKVSELWRGTHMHLHACTHVQ